MPASHKKSTTQPYDLQKDKTSGKNIMCTLFSLISGQMAGALFQFQTGKSQKGANVVSMFAQHLHRV